MSNNRELCNIKHNKAWQIQSLSPNNSDLAPIKGGFLLYRDRIPLGRTCFCIQPYHLGTVFYYSVRKQKDGLGSNTARVAVLRREFFEVKSLIRPIRGSSTWGPDQITPQIWNRLFVLAHRNWERAVTFGLMLMLMLMLMRGKRPYVTLAITSTTVFESSCPRSSINYERLF